MNLKPVAANQTELELNNGVTVFFSYKTPVACHIPGEGYRKTDKYWSRTTSKHISQFLARNGFHSSFDKCATIAQSELDQMGAA